MKPAYILLKRLHPPSCCKSNSYIPSVTMGMCEEEMECAVCYQAYTRWERIPRQLHCRHTFCTPCLRQICLSKSPLLFVRCPFCRWTTVVGPKLSLQEGLWVDNELWDQISEHQNEEREEEKEEEEQEEKEKAKQIQLTAQPKWPSLGRYRLQLEVPAVARNIFRRLQRVMPLS
ncbi:hypothetical protein AAFF_G00118530 [Aldrovandia affinis]|uniref:RING-type domain-containing protein n=1 Tax=Aldrovandia affinis TaxID=143900 RepID=A0AAD7RV90_9TELE|nr:hypothetical protein AAFF_G00118530 [Aldrovandia affinis]